MAARETGQIGGRVWTPASRREFPNLQENQGHGRRSAPLLFCVPGSAGTGSLQLAPGHTGDKRDRLLNTVPWPHFLSRQMFLPVVNLSF